MQALLFVSLVGNAFALGAFIALRASPYNMLIMACYLRTKARAIMEVRRAKAGIEIERRIAAQDLEKTLLPQGEGEEVRRGDR